MKNFFFIHGWATDTHVWKGTAEEIAEGKNIINLNLPGHGGTSKWALPTLDPALAEVVKKISTLPDRSIIGVGWSLGAQVLLAAASRVEKKISGLVLVGATPCFVSKADYPAGQSPALVKRMIMDMRKDPEATVKRFYALNFTDEEIATPGAKGFMEYYKYPGPVTCAEEGAGPAGCFPAFRYEEITRALEAIYNTDLRGILKGLDLPVLLIHGTKDSVTPFGAGEYLADNIKDAALERFDKAGHAPFITEREGFVRRVKEFCAAL
ncbi:MAG: alpha/beta fold hydrolase [Thermodesulfobacteriota bacterium]